MPVQRKNHWNDGFDGSVTSRPTGQGITLEHTVASFECPACADLNT